jgi:hypothetical protein
VCRTNKDDGISWLISVKTQIPYPSEFGSPPCETVQKIWLPLQWSTFANPFEQFVVFIKYQKCGGRFLGL